MKACVHANEHNEQCGKTWLRISLRVLQMDLVVLRRAGDTEFVKVARAVDAYALAAQLETEQPFRIQVMAIFPGSGHLLEQVQAGLPGHVRCGWYQAWPNICTAVASYVLMASDAGVQDSAMTQREVDATPQDVDATPQEAAPAHDVTTDLPVFAHVEVCARADADKATVIRTTLINRYGLEAATAMLAPLKSNVLTFGDGKQRLYTFHGQSLRLR